MFKLVLDAGHGYNTAGKRCLKSIDPNETREWTLNDRVCDKIVDRLKAYTGYEVLRVDDVTGKVDVELEARTDKANEWEANFYLSIHHNAGIHGGKGGGIVAYVYNQAGKESVEWQNDLYEAVIRHTGLKGNRSKPLSKAGFDVLKYSKMPAVLMECGFMDSTIDTPVILTDEFADQVAKAFVEVIVKRGQLKKKEVKPVSVTGVNVPRGKDDLILYVGKATTGTNQWGREVAVNAMTMEVEKVFPYRTGNNTIPAGCFVLSGHGKMETWISENIRVGETITLGVG